MKVDPTLAQALSTLITALSTAILWWAAYHWPQGHHRGDDDDTPPKKKAKKKPQPEVEDESAEDSTQ